MLQELKPFDQEKQLKELQQLLNNSKNENRILTKQMHDSIYQQKHAETIR